MKLRATILAAALTAVLAAGCGGQSQADKRQEALHKYNCGLLKMTVGLDKATVAMRGTYKDWSRLQQAQADLTNANC